MKIFRGEMKRSLRQKHQNNKNATKLGDMGTEMPDWVLVFNIYSEQHHTSQTEYLNDFISFFFFFWYILQIKIVWNKATFVHPQLLHIFLKVKLKDIIIIYIYIVDKNNEMMCCWECFCAGIVAGLGLLWTADSQTHSHYSYSLRWSVHRSDRN